MIGDFLNKNPGELFKPPLAVAVKNARFVSRFPQDRGELWTADLKLCWGSDCQVFKDILFGESDGTAFILGIEFEDGYPKGLKPAELALKQQSFIKFLRDETCRRNNALGAVSLIFSGHEYSAEARATAAYIVARGISSVMGIGYRDSGGKYELVGIDPEEDGWLEDARSIRPFDELGKFSEENQ